jgi:hypothetical protein
MRRADSKDRFSVLVAELTFMLEPLDCSDYFLSVLKTARRVNSSDSRGTLSTNGRITHPSPVGMERVKEIDSICT